MKSHDTRIHYRTVVGYEISRYPTHCSECPAFALTDYMVHNETGVEAHCGLGYMKHHDMRDFYGKTKFKGCFIEHDKRVVINEEVKG